MDTRKLIRLGNNSHVISLPNNWLKKNKLEKGNLVYFKENGNNEIVLTPGLKKVKEELKENNICIDNKTIEVVRREITAAYLNNFSIIKIYGKELPKYSAKITTIIQNLMALEIIEQTQNQIVAKDFLNINKISVSNLVRRLDIMIRSMMSDFNFSITKAEYNNIIARDKEVNRIYFMISRAIRYNIANTPSQKETFADLFLLWRTIYYLEKISDDVKDVSLLYPNKLDKKTEKKLNEIHSRLMSFYIKAMDCYYKKDKKLALELAYARNNLLKDIEKVFNTKNLIANKVAERFKSIIRKTHGIIREIYDYN